MTERKVIKAKKQAIRRARLKKAGTVAAMLPLVMSKGAPVATLIRSRHGEETPGIEQVVEMPEQEIADVVLPETPAEEVLEEEKEYEELEELEVPEALASFEAPQSFVAPRFSEGGLTSFESSDVYLEISPLNDPWDNRNDWVEGQIYSIQWISETTVRIEFSTRFPEPVGNLGNPHLENPARREYKAEINGVLSDIMIIENVRTSQGDLVYLDLVGIAPDAYGDVVIYGLDTHKYESNFRLFGGILRPNPFVPILLSEEHILLGTVEDKFVNDPITADVVQWPRLDLTRIGFLGALNFTDKIEDIIFASTDSAGPSQINYGNVDWRAIETAIETELNRQRNLDGQAYQIDLSALQAAFINTGLFEPAQVRENVPVVLQNIMVNRGHVETRAFDATRTVQRIEEHISLDFEIEMANGDRISIPELEIELPVESLLYDQAGLWASFVHLGGHEAQRAVVHEAVAQAVAHASLPEELSESLLEQLTDRIITQSRAANGLYDGQITLADAGFTPTTIGQLQSVPNKVFDNNNLIVGGQDEYAFEFEIMGDSPGGKRRFATASLVIEREYLKFANEHAGTHKIIISPYVYKDLVFTAGERDAFATEDLPLFLEEYGAELEAKIQTLAENGGLFRDAIITPRPVTWTAGTVEDRDYDGTRSVTNIIEPALVGFVDGDDNTIDVDFGADLSERLHFANSLPGTWEIEGLDFDESMLNRLDRNIAGNFNYEIVDIPTFNPATIRPLVLDVDDIDRLVFDKGTVKREYDATDVFINNLPRINVAITDVHDGNTYQFVFDTEAILRFLHGRHATDDLVSVVLANSEIGLQSQGSTVQPVQLSSDLQEALRGELFLGKITPREVFWGMGEVKDKDYDGTDTAEISVEPQLLAASDRSTGIFDVDREDTEALVLNEGSAAFATENVLRNDQGAVIAQPVNATGDWTIGGGRNADNYIIVAHPDTETIGFDMPSNLFGQSAFGMPNFLHNVLLNPSFAKATIHPLKVHFTGGYLRNASREFTGSLIIPEMSEFELPTLGTVETDKQDVLVQDLLESRVEPVEGGFVHKDNLRAGTARSALAGWGISGTHPGNYELGDSPDIMWQITAQEISSWTEIAGAQAGFATKLFDDSTDVKPEHVKNLPLLSGADLDISDWGLSFDSPDVYDVSSLFIENIDAVRTQLNDLLDGNQVLADNFNFSSLFEAEITPRQLRWENGFIPSRQHNGTVDIDISAVIPPSLVAAQAGHDIIDDHVVAEHNPDELAVLEFPNAEVGSYIFNWSDVISLQAVFSDPRHEHNYSIEPLNEGVASILPANITKADMDYKFTVASREYDGTDEIAINDFVAEIHLDGGYTILLPYRVEGLRFSEVHAGTNSLAFDSEGISVDPKLEDNFDSDDVADILERLVTEILEYQDAQITPRRIEWSVGRVANKEYDGTDKVHQILIAPELRRPNGNRTEATIVARDEDFINVVLGGARFSQTDVGDYIPVYSDDIWDLETANDMTHPLQNYTFGTDDQAGEIVQPEFEQADIKPVAVTEVRPMPDDLADMENNILYVKTGYIKRQYNGTADIDLGANGDVQEAPEFALRNAQGIEIILSLDNLDNLQVNFFDKDVAYDNGNVIDKDIITRIAGFTHDSIVLSDNGLRKIERLLFEGRITPQELSLEDVEAENIKLGGNRTIDKVYDGETEWEVREWEDPDNPGQTFKAFPELWVEIEKTGEIIHIRFDENNYVIAFAERHATRGLSTAVTIDGFYLDSRNVTLSDDLREWMSSYLLTGTITPMTIRWTTGQVERRSYDGTEEAVISIMPALPAILPIDLEDDGVIIQRGKARFDTADVRFDDAGNVVAMPVHAIGTGDDWSISGVNSGNYRLQTPIHSVLHSLIPTSQILSTIVPRPVQHVNPLFESQIIDPLRLKFNGRKIAERIFNYDYYFMAEDKSYEYGLEAGFANPEKWTNVETGQPMNVIGDYYLTITFVDQMSRLANGQSHVGEDELVFVDAQGNEIGRADVLVELRDEQGNVNRNYEYVFDDDVETIGRIIKAQGLPVTRPQAARVAETEIELFHSTITKHQPLLEEMPFLFEPFSFGDVGTADASGSNLFASATVFDPGPYEIEYAVSLSDNPEDLDTDDWQMSTLFTGLLPATEYFLFARQADHHNRYAGEIISGLASVETLAELPREPENGDLTDNGGGGEEKRRPEETNGQDKADDPDDYSENDGLILPEYPVGDEDIEKAQEAGAELPSTGDMIGSGLSILGLIALASAAILRKKNKKE